MRLIRYCALFVTALSFFVAAPSSADVIFQLNGVCSTYQNAGVTAEPIDCSTLGDPTFQLTLFMDPAYESVGSTLCLGGPGCLLKQIEWIDHADASGAAHFLDASGFGECAEAIVSGVLPTEVFVFGCGYTVSVPGFFGGGPDSVAFGNFFDPLGPHQVEGFGVWSRIDEPTPLALAALALFPLAFARRRNTANATG